MMMMMMLRELFEQRLFRRFVLLQLLYLITYYNMLFASDTFHVYILVATTAHLQNLYETPSSPDGTWVIGGILNSAQIVM